jgi:hypothetical protein
MKKQSYESKLSASGIAVCPLCKSLTKKRNVPENYIYRVVVAACTYGASVMQSTKAANSKSVGSNRRVYAKEAASLRKLLRIVGVRISKEESERLIIG